MAQKIEFTPAAERNLRQIGTTEAARIIKTLRTRIAVRDDPRTGGQALVGEWSGYWRFRAATIA